MWMRRDHGAGRHHLLPYLSLACYAAALLLTFIRFLEFDAPLTRFVRSLNDFHIDHLHNPWLADLSNLGDRIGKGESLFVVSAVLLAAGYMSRHANLQRAGWQTLVANVAAGGVNTVLKHLVGRGRPKFMHTGNSEFFPFGGSGWDSFPSGHAMAAFAVATVLALRFPKVRWLVILMALAVSVSRLFRASHFLTDIVAGAVLGVMIGAIAAHPGKDWRSSSTSALFLVTPPLAALLAIMNAIGQGPLEARTVTLLSQGGLLTVLIAMITYVLLRVRPTLLPIFVTKTGIVALMGLGIALCSGSMWVATVIVLLCLGYSLRTDQKIRTEETAAFPAWPSEAAFGLGVLLTVITMMELRGALPLG